MNIAEILYVNPRTRSAFVLDEVHNKVVEVPLAPMCRDEDSDMNTWEDLPKEGSKVYIEKNGGSYRITGIQPRNYTEKEFDQYRGQRGLLGVNPGDPLLYGINTADLRAGDGYVPYGGEEVGGKDPVYRKGGITQYDFSGISYDDLLPGDKVMSTKDGNAIGVLEGGVVVLKASELCQIVGVRYDDLMRIVSRNFEHFTDFGNVIVRNRAGKVSYIVEGSDSQSSARMGKINVRMSMGSEGGLYKVEVLDGSGRVMSQFHMKSDGSVARKSASLFENILKDARIEIGGDLREVVSGNAVYDFRGDRSSTTKGNDTQVVVGNHIQNTQNDDVLMVGRNVTRVIGGVSNETIRGAILSTEAVTRDIFVGGKRETITTTGDFKQNILGAGNFSRYTTAGNIEESTLAGKLTRSTQAGNIEDSITVGQYKLSVINGTAKLEAGIGGINGSVEINSTSVKIKEGIGAELHLAAGKVALGFAANELLNLVNLIIVQLNNTEVAIANHIHGSVMGPTTPPTNAAAFMNANAQLLTIKGRLISITGTL